MLLPAVLGQHRRAGAEIGERRGIGRRRLGAPAGQQIELGQLLAFVRDVIKAAPRLSWLTISKIASSRCSGGVCAASSRPIRRWASARVVFRDQRIGGLLHAVVDEFVGAA